MNIWKESISRLQKLSNALSSAKAKAKQLHIAMFCFAT
jgi:hypothetical protein